MRELEADAAGYIVKTFSPSELVARVVVELNRHAVPRPLVLGDLAIDRATHRAAEQGQHAIACQVARRHFARHKGSLTAIARCAMKLDTRL